MEGYPYQNYDQEAGDLFRGILSREEGAFIGRIGGTDWDLAAYYFFKVYQTREHCSKSIIEDPHFYWRIDTIEHYNGYYDRDGRRENAVVFCEHLLDVYRSFDYATVGHGKLLATLGFLKKGEWGYDEESGAEYRTAPIGSIVTCKLSNYRFIEDMYGFYREIFPLLEGLRVLVCSPFCHSFTSQLLHRDVLFQNHPAIVQYPRFELIPLVTPVTYRDTPTYPHRNWSETSEALCAQIENISFDVALLGCGSYALTLGKKVKNLGKKAIYMGGALQLYFGVKGRRYVELEHYRTLMNEHWIYPLERPPVVVTGGEIPRESWGAYW